MHNIVQIKRLGFNSILKLHVFRVYLLMNGILKILYICPRMPSLPIRAGRSQGYRGRAFYQIRELSKNHKITLISFSEDNESAADQRVLKKMCDRLIIIPHNTSTAIRNVVHHLSTSMPLQCAFYQSRRMKEAIVKELSENSYDIIHIQLARMMPYGGVLKSVKSDKPILFDFIDALSLNMKKRLERDRVFFKPFFFYEWYKMKKYENRLKFSFDTAVITSSFDRKCLPYYKWIKVLPNGVDLDYFHFCDPSQRDRFTIIFTGTMSYFPNIDAVVYFTRYVYPLIRKAVPQVKFKIVGGNPTPIVRKLCSHEKNIEVAGYVEDIVAELGKATVAIAPMLSGSGIQNKILEAMATGTPIVATNLATQAIELKSNRDIIISNDPDGFASAVIKILANRSIRHKLGQNARKVVEKKYSWKIIGKRLESIYKDILVTHGKS